MQLDPTGTTVSGVSSGAYMAVQLHIDNSRSIIGAGVVAGGPYFCAEGQLLTALNRCIGMNGAGVFRRNLRPTPWDSPYPSVSTLLGSLSSR